MYGFIFPKPIGHSINSNNPTDMKEKEVGHEDVSKGLSPAKPDDGKPAYAKSGADAVTFPVSASEDSDAPTINASAMAQTSTGKPLLIGSKRASDNETSPKSQPKVKKVRFEENACIASPNDRNQTAKSKQPGNLVTPPRQARQSFNL
jgi:hypothetical protein